jgi:hypothetical protein
MGTQGCAAAVAFAFLAVCAAGEVEAPPAAPTVGDGAGSWFWPLQFDLPESVKQANPRAKAEAGQMPVLVWVPPEAKRIRALLLIRANSDSMAFGAHKAVREVAAQHAMAIMYFRCGLEGGAAARPLIRKFSDAPEADRKKMFWVADRELAGAWFEILAVRGQTFDVP